MGAQDLLYMKSIETHAREFSRLISDGISGVSALLAVSVYLFKTETANRAET